MGEASPESQPSVVIDPLWVPSRGLDPDTYEDVFAHSKGSGFPARAALSDAASSAGVRAWCTLLAEGFVADRLLTADDVERSIPIRAAVFAAQSAMGMVPAAATVRAGLLGVTLLDDGEGVAVAAGRYAVLRVAPDGTVLRWNASPGNGLSVFDEVGDVAGSRQIDVWTFRWRPGDTILLCGRGVPEAVLRSAEQWKGESLPAFQGRIRKAFLSDGPPRSATVVRMAVR